MKEIKVGRTGLSRNQFWVERALGYSQTFKNSTFLRLSKCPILVRHSNTAFCKVIWNYMDINIAIRFAENEGVWLVNWEIAHART